MNALANIARYAAPKVLMNCAALVAGVLLLSSCAVFRGDRPETSSAAADTKGEATAEKAAEIATQPARDLGVAKPEIPDVLVQATADPYARRSTATCKQLATEIAALNEHLGADFTPAQPEDKAARLAAAGGKSVINSLIPFRALVREMTGAAAAQRRYEDAVDAGYSRRGFLRGIQRAKKCRARP